MEQWALAPPDEAETRLAPHGPAPGAARNEAGLGRRRLRRTLVQLQRQRWSPVGEVLWSIGVWAGWTRRWQIVSQSRRQQVPGM